MEFQTSDTIKGYNGPARVPDKGDFSDGNAGIAELVEQLISNQQVVGWNPIGRSSLFPATM